MKIVSIIRVEDTRQWEEGPDDKWYPVPGSGVEHQCARCGRNHEIHATVALEDDSMVIVGTGCMTADESEIAGKVRSILNSQKTLRKLERELVRQKELKAKYQELRQKVDSLPVPAVVTEVTEKIRAYETRPSKTVVYRIGDASAWQDIGFGAMYDDCDGERKAERVSCATYQWKENRAKELGCTYQMTNAASYGVADYEKRIENQKKKLATFEEQK